MNEPAFTPDISGLEEAKADGGDMATQAFEEDKDIPLSLLFIILISSMNIEG